MTLCFTGNCSICDKAHWSDHKSLMQNNNQVTNSLIYIPSYIILQPLLLVSSSSSSSVIIVIVINHHQSIIINIISIIIISIIDHHQSSSIINHHHHHHQHQSSASQSSSSSSSQWMLLSASALPKLLHTMSGHFKYGIYDITDKFSLTNCIQSRQLCTHWVHSHCPHGYRHQLWLSGCMHSRCTANVCISL